MVWESARGIEFPVLRPAREQTKIEHGVRKGGGARGKGRATTCRRTASMLPNKFLSFFDAKFSPSTVAHAEVLH